MQHLHQHMHRIIAVFLHAISLIIGCGGGHQEATLCMQGLC
jgi:hypothetical protein